MQTFSVYSEDAEMFCGVGIPHKDKYMEEVFYCPFCGSEELEEYWFDDEDEDE